MNSTIKKRIVECKKSTFLLRDLRSLRGWGYPLNPFIPLWQKKSAVEAEAFPLRTKTTTFLTGTLRGRKNGKHYICRNCPNYPPNPPVKLSISQAKNVSSF